MNKDRLEQLIHNRERIEALPGSLVSDILEKANPKWEGVIEKIQGGTAGPAYACQVQLPGDVTLDIVLVAYSEWLSEPVDPTKEPVAFEIPGLPVSPGYHPFQWQLVVAEGNSIRTNIRDDGRFPCPVRSLFEAVEQKYKGQNLMAMEPSAERTLAIARQYLDGKTQ